MVNLYFSFFELCIKGLPEFQLKIFNITTQEIIAETHVSDASEDTKIIFNPNDWHSFCVYNR